MSPPFRLILVFAFYNWFTHLYFFLFLFHIFLFSFFFTLSYIDKVILQTGKETFKDFSKRLKQ